MQRFGGSQCLLRAQRKHTGSARQAGAIASEYHERLQTPPAFSDLLSEALVVPALSEAIVEGVLPPGSRLSEVQIVKQLNVSRTPMREAVVQLEREVLATILPRVGAHVRTVTRRDVEEIYTVRAALECLAVQEAAARIMPLALTAMQAALDAGDAPG
jgi:DNA-binding GntR family transcriptional regulator